ncbi:competence/damage-inducible protein A [Sulfurospirillum sp. T05]|uniref:Competence/damage-inducible protein A n=1 Tax=Sulfurospirillum tamanense TaxID=2813362 RepID=A0ABS2WSW7_9BACT|nr:molybdopterin-binding protein [Sulfurospirillum tamanensis]MBN2964758.1 competence/damage-inducible protein A [Sulfurospirillum tamanensis]
MKRFFSVIVGSELLNGRRVDKHFTFLLHALKKRGWTLEGNFVIKDDPALMHSVFSLLKSQPNTYIFSFGGIGATPDDCTREVVANVFRDGTLAPHPQAQALIHAQFGDHVTSHRLRMGELPKDVELLTNVVNQTPGFALDGRFFFMPGFPSMAWPMAKEALERYVGTNPVHTFTCNFLVETGESELIALMQALPKEVELSSLPHLRKDGAREVEIYLACKDQTLLFQSKTLFFNNLSNLGIPVTVLDD